MKDAVSPIELTPRPSHCRQKQCHLPERKPAVKSPAGLPIQSVSHSCQTQPPPVTQPTAAGASQALERRLFLRGLRSHLRASTTPFSVFFPPSPKLTFYFTDLNEASDKMCKTSDDKMASGGSQRPAGSSILGDRICKFTGGCVFLLLRPSLRAAAALPSSTVSPPAGADPRR